MHLDLHIVYHFQLILQGTPADDLVVSILAIDRGDPRLTGSTTVRVLLTDINDFPPEFSQSEYTTTALSTAPVSTSLFQLDAVDRDGVDNDITYSIVDDNSTTVQFSIDGEGVVRNDESFPSVSTTQVDCLFSSLTR